MKRISLLILAGCFTLVTTNAFAVPQGLSTSTVMPVTATIIPQVQITSTPLNFGNVVAGDSSNATASIEVIATVGTVYTSIDLDAGLNHFGTTRRVVTPTEDTIDYGVFMDAGRTQPWGDGGVTFSPPSFLTTLPGTGAGQFYTVYGRLQTVASTPAGTYTDTVTVTVNY